VQVLDKDSSQALKMPSADEIDHITPEERKALMGFCESDEAWWKFTRDGSPELCPICGHKPSQQIGFQVMTQRTFDPVLHGKKKLKNKGGKRLR